MWMTNKHTHHMQTALFLVAVLGATAFTPPRPFGPPRTRALALAHAKKADKDSVATPVPPLKGRVDTMIGLASVPGTPTLASHTIMRMPGLTGRRYTAGSVIVPVAAASALAPPVVILYSVGDISATCYLGSATWARQLGLGNVLLGDTDTFKRARAGVTLKQRAIGDFQRGLSRVRQRVGVLAQPLPGWLWVRVALSLLPTRLVIIFNKE